MEAILNFMRSIAFASWNPFKFLLGGNNSDSIVTTTSLKNEEGFTGKDWFVLIFLFLAPLIALFFLLKWLGVFRFLGFGKRSTYRRRRRPNIIRRAVSAVRRTTGKAAMQKRMARVRAARKKGPRKKSTRKK